MLRSPAISGRSRSSWAWAVALLIFGGVTISGAQDAQPQSGGFVLRSGAQDDLAGFQREWLDWLTACNENDRAGASEAVVRLVSRARLVGMSGLPRLSVGAAAQAVAYADSGGFEQAEWALEAAEQLDSGRPETAFAEAAVARLQGRRLSALAASGRGLLGIARLRLERSILLYDAGLWLGLVVTLIALTFVALQMVVRGPWLYRDLLTVPIRFAPVAMSHLLVVAALVWPLLLPAGLLWLALYWSLLLWLYGAKFERLLFVGAWVLILGLPVLLVLQGRRLESSLSPTLATVEAAAVGRLEGTLFLDISELQTRLPESLAVSHLMADMHRKVGQCDLARELYEAVLEQESENVGALIDLGACHHSAGNFERAIELFQQAASGREPHAAVQFNLAQAYSELYRFDESEAALRVAQELDGSAVSRWLQVREAVGVVTANGGLARVAEIAAQQARLSGDELEIASAGIGRWMLPLPPLAVLIAVAVGLHLAVRKFGDRNRELADQWWEGTAENWRRVLLPGVAEAEEGAWLRAVLAAAPVALLCCLPVVGRLGLALPLGLQPALGSLALVALIGVVLILGVRAWREFWG